MGPLFTAHVTAGIRTRLARILRVPVFVIGKLLSVIGIFTLTLSVGLIPFAVMYEREEDNETSTWVALAVAVAASVLAVALGRLSMRGSRHLVLFLRKFGYGDASAVTSFAVEHATGRCWRLVTLDDAAATSPIGVSPGTRRRANWVAGLGILALLVGFAVLTLWLVNGGPDALYESTIRENDARFESANPDPSIGDSMGHAIFSGLAAGLGLVMVIAMAVGGLLVVYTVCVDAWLTRVAVRRAERSKQWTITDDHDVGVVAGAVAERADRIHAPRLFVVKSSDRVWKAAVSSLAGRADVVLIDISRPTENLLWEIRELRLKPGPRLAVVCAADSAAALQQHPGDPRQRALQLLLDGEQVLVYGTGPADIKEFARSLRNMLDRAAHDSR